jgi:hypothetical protein
MRAHRTFLGVTTSILFTGALLVGCDRGDRPAPTAVRSVGPQADLGVVTDATAWLQRALNIGVILSTDPTAIAWTDVDESDEASDAITVVPFEFDPGRTFLVRARWLRGTGCPTGAATDPACLGTGDVRNEGLLLVKTGPTSTNAAAGADIKGVKGIMLSELGYDIRKPVDPTDPRGSHCGAGAPRFNVQTTTAFYFVGCNSPPARVVLSSSVAWLRLRWDTPCVMGFNAATGVAECITTPVVSIAIVFDEGTDTGPDDIGLAVLDNIDINGTLVGRGPGN